MDWDDYWSKGNRKGLYNFFASIYRCLIFKKNLNYYAGKYFTEGSLILHAGCGSGQVDSDMVKRYRLVALDISVNAIAEYKKNNTNADRVLRASIFSLPFPEGSFDAVYNLGVMEHFEKDEIKQALNEIKRVLKVNGKVLIFWPPEFGTSVLLIKLIKAILKNILRKNKELHPAEVSRLKSKREAISLFEQCGFEVEKVFFNIYDLLTMFVIVAKKTR